MNWVHAWDQTPEILLPISLLCSGQGSRRDRIHRVGMLGWSEGEGGERGWKWTSTLAIDEDDIAIVPHGSVWSRYVSYLTPKLVLCSRDTVRPGLETLGIL